MRRGNQNLYLPFFCILFLQQYEAEKLNATDNSALIHYIHNFHTVYPAVEWRITLIGEVQKGGASIVHVSLGLIVAAVLLTIFN